ncbi:SusC/RagA family TonB-linked outer membrane protein [Sphingobacterium sp. 2149]|uniref:SusC/RagA family TonB-linked outer membrane protein n=1 Tax=Sphingobacterium sp. 2149 TaxID=2817763 RepID=UPI002854410D|nr:SusC/RagA family TonB-linked outer membrane protein [Sphingobacterium sp. 2149]MDR6733800.1 TonB-linked SusC/RagA family outer membrane protein [Sphingobacterium sp. 2149]
MTRIISSILATLCCFTLFAQGRYSGKVIDQKMHPIADANIKLVGSTSIYRTDSLGKFEISSIVTPLTVSVSAIGFETQKVSWNSYSANLIISMQTKENKLNEVQVNTGYQIMPKERSTGSFGVVSNKDFNKIPSRGILDRIEGKVSGLQFDRRSGKSVLNIRGINTFSEIAAQPLIVVDNFPYDGTLDDLNPNDVESVSVLKDAAASSIWGSRAGNGVIVVTTKKGKVGGKPTINFTTTTMVSSKPDLFYNKVINSKDFIDVERFLFDNKYYDDAYNSAYNQTTIFSPVVDMLYANKGGRLSDIDLNTRLTALEGNDYRNDLMKYVYQATVNQQYFLDISTSNATNRNRYSVGYDRGKGDTKGANNDRLTLRAVNSWQLGQKLSIENTLSLINGRDRIFSSTPRYPMVPGGGRNTLYPYASLADAEENFLSIPRFYNSSFLEKANADGLLDWNYRPLADRDKSTYKAWNRHLYLNFNLHYDILPFLKADLIYGYEHSNTKSESLSGENSFEVRDLINKYTRIVNGAKLYDFPFGAILRNTDNEMQSHRGRVQVSFNKSFGGDHVLNALIGTELYTRNADQRSSGSYGYNAEVLSRKSMDYNTIYQLYGGLGYGFVTPLDSYAGTLSRTVSIYFNGLYEYKGKYGLYFSARKDAANSFGTNVNSQWNPLWSAGLSWQIAKEKFMKETDWIDHLKMRSTFGYGGVQPYGALNKTVIGYVGNSNYSNLPYALIGSPPNPGLKWETVRTLNFGMDFSIYGGKLMANLDYYRKKSFDLLSDDPLDPTSGYSLLTKNVGQIATHGIDLTLASSGRFGKGYWQSSINFSYSKNKVTDYRGTIGATNLYLDGGRTLMPLLGKSLYPVFSYKSAGLDPVNGDPRGYKNSEISKDYQALTTDSLQYLNYHGTALPPIYGAWNNTIGYGKFYLDFSLLFKLGHYFKKKSIVYGSLFDSWDGHADFAKRWQQPGDELATAVPSMQYPNDSYRDLFYQHSSNNIVKGDLIRMQNIRLGYNFGLNDKKIKGQLYIGANNVGLIWRKNKENLDPDYLDLPAPRVISVGGNINF